MRKGSKGRSGSKGSKGRSGSRSDGREGREGGREGGKGKRRGEGAEWDMESGDLEGCPVDFAGEFVRQGGLSCLAGMLGTVESESAACGALWRYEHSTNSTRSPPAIDHIPQTERQSRSKGNWVECLV